MHLFAGKIANTLAEQKMAVRNLMRGAAPPMPRISPSNFGQGRARGWVLRASLVHQITMLNQQKRPTTHPRIRPHRVGRSGSRQPDDNGFHMMMQRPPLVGAIIGPWDHSHQALSDTGECVLAVPTVTETVVDIGNCSGDALDKFAHFGLTPASRKL